MTKILVLMAAMATASVGDVTGTAEDERTIREVVRARESAWNHDDTNRYGQLMTPNADIISATGRSAIGRNAVLALYSEQRQGVYKKVITTTPVETIRFIRPDVALVNANFRLTGLRATDGTPAGERKGRLLLVLVKDGGRWLITAMRGMPEAPILLPK